MLYFDYYRPRSTLNQRERKTIDTDSPNPRKLREHRVSSNISAKIADEKEMNHSRLVKDNASFKMGEVILSMDILK